MFAKLAVHQRRVYVGLYIEYGVIPLLKLIIAILQSKRSVLECDIKWGSFSSIRTGEGDLWYNDMVAWCSSLIGEERSEAVWKNFHTSNDSGIHVAKETEIVTVQVDVKWYVICDGQWWVVDWNLNSGSVTEKFCWVIINCKEEIIYYWKIVQYIIAYKAGASKLYNDIRAKPVIQAVLIIMERTSIKSWRDIIIL